MVFGRASPLSNHHLCNFSISRSFTCVEHFLAWQRASISDVKQLATSVLGMKDSVEHKRVLTSLREFNQEKWDELVGNVLKTAPRSKSKQSHYLRKFLCDTQPKSLGEASIVPKWGVGMMLADKEVLNIEKWNKEGNLLRKRNFHLHEPAQRPS